ncbi:hypothetical protein ACQ4WP_21210 [Janthinobacterium sp. GB4P2]|uniref:hypothetical protein n=1 Tax=Janthinobacterium sp. GB4P2 TaxID=3424189 RepID=UPI003F1F55B0
MNVSREKRAWAAALEGVADTVFRTGMGGEEPAMIVLEQGKCEFLRIFKPLPWCEGDLQNDSN